MKTVIVFLVILSSASLALAGDLNVRELLERDLGDATEIESERKFGTALTTHAQFTLPKIPIQIFLPMFICTYFINRHMLT